MSNENVIARAATKERYEVLKAMNLLARVTNNEGFYYNHWIYIIPDGADDEELMDIATEDVDTFNDAVVCFLDHWDEYALDGGLYIGKTVYPKCGCTTERIFNFTLDFCSKIRYNKRGPKKTNELR